MRPPHLTNDLDALLLETLKRAVAETEIPECMREAVIGLLTGSMDLYTADEEHNPVNLGSIEKAEELLGSRDFSPWYSICGAIHMLTPLSCELDGDDSYWAERRVAWDSTAGERLTQALHLLDNPPPSENP